MVGNENLRVCQLSSWTNCSSGDSYHGTVSHQRTKEQIIEQESSGVTILLKMSNRAEDRNACKYLSSKD